MAIVEPVTSREIDDKTCRLLTFLKHSLFIPSLFGSFPFTLGRCGKLFLKPWWFVYSCICTVLPTLLFLYSLSPANNILMAKSSYVKLMYILSATPMVLATLICPISTILGRGSFQHTINSILKVEISLCKIGINAKWKASIWFTVIHFGSIFALIELNRRLIEDFVLAEWSTFLLPQLAILVLTANLEIGTVLIKVLKHQSNELLRRINMVALERDLVLLCEIQDIQADALSCIQTSLKLQTLIAVIDIFLFTNTNIFLIIRKLKQSRYMVFWIIIVIIPLIQLTAQCELFRAKTDEFHLKLYYILKNHESDKLACNEQLCAHLLKKKSTKFSVCGFFDIDFEFIGYFFGAVATFSVILLQMGTSYSV